MTQHPNGPLRARSLTGRAPVALAAALLALGALLPAQDRRPAAVGSTESWITPEVREAVARGLAFLAAQQHPDGYWSQDVGFKLNTNYRVTAENVPHIGVTALALISFLAGGNVPGRGTYGDVLERGLGYVLSHVQDDGYITDQGSRMYSHAFATLFLAEIYGMTSRADVRRELQSAVNIIVDSQNTEGGWRYKPFARESDMSITVCQVLALRSARNVGIAVPARTIRDAERYVRRSAVRSDTFGGYGQPFQGYSPYDDGGAFRYQLRGHSRATFPLTAAGVTTLHAAGIYDDPIIDDAFDYMRDRMDEFNRYYQGHYFFYYGHYYAVQAYYTAGGSRFDDYFPRIREQLLRMQQINGSWPSHVGPGEAFATAVATLILQIPYQYLPIFQR
ncbi:MAG: terpene cyclase/mutase family protein [Planctomycetes bacterium]|nr:terpene cyclase/mutase family protein [Planctomycetota bacterium]